MPELKIYAAEGDLAYQETTWISTLTDAVVDVYGEWAREIVTVRLLGVPDGRWGVGGRAVAEPAPTIELQIREAAFERPDADELIAHLASAVSAAVTAILGEPRGSRAVLELVAVPAGRTAVGGALVD